MVIIENITDFFNTISTWITDNPMTIIIIVGGILVGAVLLKYITKGR